MSGIQVRVNVADFDRVAGGITSRLGDLSGFLREKAVPIIRNSIAAEFLNQEWRKPNGGRDPWRPLVPFGNRSGASPGVLAGGQHKPLINSGALFNAWTGQGSGGLVKIGPRSVVVGVQKSAFPFAEYLRGGVAGRIRTSPLLIFPEKRVAGGGQSKDRKSSWVRQWALWWFLGLTYGVWLREQTLRDGMKLHPRPHATRNPEMTRQLRRSFAAYIRRAA